MTPSSHTLSPPAKECVRILHLEDNGSDRELIKALLEEEGIGCAIRAVDTREEFLDAVRRDDWDLVLSDYTLPGFDGTLALTLAVEVNPDIPFIFVTGTMGEDVAVESIKKGAIDYVLKQNITRLPSAINRALKEREERLQRLKAEAELRQSEQQFHTLAELVPQLVWICSPDGSNIYCNQRWVSYTGMAPGENTGGDWEFPFHPDDRHPAWTTWNHRSGDIGSHRMECRLRAKDGSYRWFLADRAPLVDDEGNILKWFGTFTDIEDLKRAEEDLRESHHALVLRAEELNRSNAELQQFAYVASHDLQEPLRMVASYTQLLGKRYRGRLDADADEFIRYAVEGAQRMKTLINDILAYSRVNTSPQKFVWVDCESLLATAMDNLEIATQEARATIYYDPLPTVQGDPTQLGEVFQNLIGNALKFRGKREPLVHISANMHEGEWRFSVCDNGIGIDPQNAERVFAIFQRLHTREEYPGTGIGLAMCRKIVERHHGKIWVEPNPEAGSTFFFTLPAQTALTEA